MIKRSEGRWEWRVRPSGWPQGETGAVRPKLASPRLAGGPPGSWLHHGSGAGRPSNGYGPPYDLYELSLGVANLADGRPAIDGHPPHLSRGEPQCGEVSFFGHQLDAGPGTAAKLAATTRLQLDVVQDRPHRDEAHRHGIADPDFGPLPAAQHVPYRQAGRRQNIALLAIVVVQQGDAGVAVGVVLDRGDRRRDAVLGALKVDDAVLAFVAAPGDGPFYARRSCARRSPAWGLSTTVRDGPS